MAAFQTLSSAQPSKYHISKARIIAAWGSLPDDQKTTALKDEKVQKLKDSGFFDTPIAKVAEEASSVAFISIEHANEYIKLMMKVVKGADKFEEIALKALEGDAMKGQKVKAAENLLKRLIKAGSDGKAFRTKAKEHF